MRLESRTANLLDESWNGRARHVDRTHFADVTVVSGSQQFLLLHRNNDSFVNSIS